MPRNDILVILRVKDRGERAASPPAPPYPLLQPLIAVLARNDEGVTKWYAEPVEVQSPLIGRLSQFCHW